MGLVYVQSSNTRAFHILNSCESLVCINLYKVALLGLFLSSSVPKEMEEYSYRSVRRLSKVDIK